MSTKFCFVVFFYIHVYMFVYSLLFTVYIINLFTSIIQITFNRDTVGDDHNTSGSDSCSY